MILGIVSFIQTHLGNRRGGRRKVRPNQDKELTYETLSLENIKNIHKQVFTLCDDKCNIFMWTIDKYLFETEQMMRELGYTLHARMIWDKGNGVAPAFTVRYSHEYLLWFYKKVRYLNLPMKLEVNILRL